MVATPSAASTLPEPEVSNREVAPLESSVAPVASIADPFDLTFGAGGGGNPLDLHASAHDDGRGGGATLAFGGADHLADVVEVGRSCEVTAATPSASSILP